MEKEGKKGRGAKDVLSDSVPLVLQRSAHPFVQDSYWVACTTNM